MADAAAITVWRAYPAKRLLFRLKGTEAEVRRLWDDLERVTVPGEDLLLLVRISPGSWRQAGLLNPLEVPLTRVF